MDSNSLDAYSSRKARSVLFSDSNLDKNEVRDSAHIFLDLHLKGTTNVDLPPYHSAEATCSAMKRPAMIERSFIF